MVAASVLLFSLVAIQQGPPVERGPASQEIAALKKADQAARQFTTPPSKEEWDRIGIGDIARENRIRQLLALDLVVTRDDFSNAALILQHGQDAEDYELARELSIIACFKGGLESLPALAEDRFLSSIQRKQRFGSQFTWEGELKDLDAAGPAPVEDWLRLDYLSPTLAAYREHGLKAAQAVQEQIFKRIQDRVLDKRWRAEASKWPETLELARLFRRHAGRDADYRAIERVLDFYRADRIGTPEALHHAAGILLTSSEAQVVLLSGELAALSAMRQYKPALNLTAKAWDKFLVIVGRPDRYGTISGAERVSPAVARMFVGKG